MLWLIQLGCLEWRNRYQIEAVINDGHIILNCKLFHVLKTCIRVRTCMNVCGDNYSYCLFTRTKRKESRREELNRDRLLMILGDQLSNAEDDNDESHDALRLQDEILTSS